MKQSYGTLEQRARDECFRDRHTRIYADDNVCACGCVGIGAFPEMASATRLSRSGESPALPVLGWHPPSFEI